jgi:hypothetical protein
MDIKKEILRGHTKTQVNKVVKLIGRDPKKFKALVEIYLEGPYRVTQRAAWPLSYCVEEHPELIEPHLKTILDYTKKPGVHDAVKRNTVRLLQFIDIPKRFHARIAEMCFAYLQDTKEPIAIRVFSMTVLSKIVRAHPDMKEELRITIEDLMPYGSAAFLSRGKKVLKELNIK